MLRVRHIILSEQIKIYMGSKSYDMHPKLGVKLVPYFYINLLRMALHFSIIRDTVMEKGAIHLLYIYDDYLRAHLFLLISLVLCNQWHKTRKRTKMIAAFHFGEGQPHFASLTSILEMLKIFQPNMKSPKLLLEKPSDIFGNVGRRPKFLLPLTRDFCAKS